MWTHRDRMEARAWREVDAGRCPGCRGDLDETTDPDNEDAYDGHLVTCFKCAAKAQALDEFSKAGGKTAGVLSYSTGSPEITVS